MCGQALERQKEYFDCIRNERDELRDELADIKGKAKAGEVRLPTVPEAKLRLEQLAAGTNPPFSSCWLKPDLQ